MPYAIQYSQDSGATFQQFGITTEDITLNIGGVADVFSTVKDSKDNVYILCQKNTNGFAAAKIIKIDKNGEKTIGSSMSNSLGYTYSQKQRSTLSMSRDEQYILFNAHHNTSFEVGVVAIPVNNISTYSTWINMFGNAYSECNFALYQDRYIWVASESTVKIYNYETKAELASSGVSWDINGIACDTNNVLYIANSRGATYELGKYVYNQNAITYTTYNLTADVLYGKQMLIDKWGDLIIITNNGTASTLLKYSTAGVKIGDTITLSGAMYNLNTDKDGNYYYSNALGTYKVPKNTAQGQAIAPLSQHIKIRDNGMTTFGNNISGYNPAVFE